MESFALILLNWLKSYSTGGTTDLSSFREGVTLKEGIPLSFEQEMLKHLANYGYISIIPLWVAEEDGLRYIEDDMVIINDEVIERDDFIYDEYVFNY